MLQSQLSPHEVAYQESVIQEREAEIQEIQAGIEDIAQIFRDLGSLVNEQGEMIGECLSSCVGSCFSISISTYWAGATMRVCWLPALGFLAIVR